MPGPYLRLVSSVLKPEKPWFVGEAEAGMLGKIFRAVFGCWHAHYSFPMSERSCSRRSKAALLTGT